MTATSADWAGKQTHLPPPRGGGVFTCSVFTYFNMIDQIFGIEQVVRGGQQYTPLNESDVYHVLETILGLEPEEDVDVIQMQSPNPRRIDVCTKGLYVWTEKDLYSFMDRQYDLDNGKIVLICRPYEDFSTVRIKRMPAFWKSDTVERIMRFYGVVKSIRKEDFRSSRNYKGISNGIWSVKMKIGRSMPSTMTVQGCRFEIYYQGQEQTCWRCGMAHRKSDCRTPRNDFVNTFAMSNFPERPEPEVSPVPSSAESEPERTPDEVIIRTPVITTEASSVSTDAPVVVTNAVPCAAAVSTSSSEKSGVAKEDLTKVSDLADLVTATSMVERPSMEIGNESTTFSPINNKASVSTVNVINEVIMSASQTVPGSQSVDTDSDGTGTVDRAYREYVAPLIEVHHANNSQGLGSLTASSVMDGDWESTLFVAEEEPQDHLLTPAQGALGALGFSAGQGSTDVSLQICQDDKKRKGHGTSEEDNLDISDNDSIVGPISNDSCNNDMKNEPKKVKQS